MCKCDPLFGNFCEIPVPNILNCNRRNRRHVHNPWGTFVSTPSPTPRGWGCRNPLLENPFCRRIDPPRIRRGVPANRQNNCLGTAVYHKLYRTNRGYMYICWWWVHKYHCHCKVHRPPGIFFLFWFWTLHRSISQLAMLLELEWWRRRRWWCWWWRWHWRRGWLTWRWRNCWPPFERRRVDVHNHGPCILVNKNILCWPQPPH